MPARPSFSRPARARYIFPRTETAMLTLTLYIGVAEFVTDLLSVAIVLKALRCSHAAQIRMDVTVPMRSTSAQGSPAFT